MMLLFASSFANADLEPQEIETSVSDYLYLEATSDWATTPSRAETQVNQDLERQLSALIPLELKSRRNSLRLLTAAMSSPDTVWEERLHIRDRAYGQLYRSEICCGIQRRLVAERLKRFADDLKGRRRLRMMWAASLPAVAVLWGWIVVALDRRTLGDRRIAIVFFSVLTGGVLTLLTIELLGS